MKGLLLLSGGFDSPVAGRMMLRQGASLEAVHFSFEPVTDRSSTEKAIVLARWLGLSRLWVVRVGAELARVPHDREAHRYYFLIQKRLFYRLADSLAQKVGADVLVTGENLAQVSSQTLSNLVTLEAAARRPVVRPLLGLDKAEIIALAKEWGSYETSVGPELCDLLGPAHPATRSNPAAVLIVEGRVGLPQELGAGIEAEEIQVT